ncbi:LysM peptidoglycan-binding domain-containing protein [Pontibacter toksunensis]|uniref:LysM peptidoglycan-binding domain-containing protein n=1 Tax=Pontibacter toksunensis TaxID=1332631 RepID=A0ABW6BVI1_9BACT
MGLMDFFKKGEKAPAKPAAKPATNPKGTEKVTTTPGNPNHAFYNEKDMNQIKPATPTQDIYTVQSGDSLSKIAKKHYGDANTWKRIYEANKDTVGPNPDLIRPGQRLVIPRD